MSVAGRASLVGLVAEAAQRRPAAEALIGAGERVTYADLCTRASNVATVLTSLGIVPGDRVVLLSRNTPACVAGYLGVLAAGAVVVPIAEETPAIEMEARIAHCEPEAILGDRTSPGADASASHGKPPVLELGELTGARGTGNLSECHDRLVADPDALAALVYTSGTTGAPKAVMLSHRNLASNVIAVMSSLQLRPTDRVFSPLPLEHAYGNSVVHTHLAAGASVVFGNLMFPQRGVETMLRERVTGLSVVPTSLRVLLDRTTFVSAAASLSALRYITVASSRATAADIERTTTAHPDAAFYVMYGQTEATARLTYLPPEERPRRPLSVGRPIANTRIEIRRPDRAVAAVGEIGDVVASGPGIMLGYWRAPGDTDAAFIDDDRGRWLRTGDLGHLDDDGYLYLDGRSVEMIKSGGYRINPEEIEEAALEIPGVREAAAVGVPDPLFGEVVELLIVTTRTLSAAEVLAYFQDRLLAHKRPRRVRFVDALPRTASGKLQRRHAGAQVA